MLIIMLSLSILINLTLGYLLIKSIKRMLDFDDLYELLSHDIETNIAYFSKLVDTPLFSNSPEILDAQRNIKIMRDRMNEYSIRIDDIIKKEVNSHINA